MLAAGTLSARRSTERTPFCGGPTTTLSDHGRAPSSPRLTATPPPLGRRMLRLIFSNDHLLPRCWSSTTRLPFLRPISLRFCPSSPVRLRLSSQSRPARMPLCVGSVEGVPAVGGVTGICRGNVAGSPTSLPLPLGAGADCGWVRRQGRARRSPSSAPVPASLPIPGSYYEPLPAPTSPSTSGRVVL